MIELVWRAAAGLSLVHDVSDGGLETALQEMAEWSTEASDNLLLAEVEVPEPHAVRFVLAGATVPDFAVEVGQV